MTARSTTPTSPSPRAARLRLLLALALFMVVGLSATGCGSSAPEPEATAPQQGAPSQTEPTEESAEPSKSADEVTELKIEDLKVGDGAEATAGKTVTVHYTGWLTDGTKFDSSKDSGQPFTFQLGAGQVIPGWDQGVEGMKVGGTRKLTIPPNLAYGEQGAVGVIPPNAVLVFEVELLGVQ